MQAQTLKDIDMFDLIFNPGFSTRDQADTFAGRGIGMDVVKTRIESLRGSISVDSSKSKGTRFTIRLPLTLSITKALCCISNRARIAFPMDSIEDMLDLHQDEIKQDRKQRLFIRWREQNILFKPLSELLKYNRSLSRSTVYAGGAAEDDMLSIIILRTTGDYLAVQVDWVEGEKEIVIKQLERPIPKPSGIAGVTVLSDGQILPIVDVLELAEMSRGRLRQPLESIWKTSVPVVKEPVTDQQPVVLIVDDSITVRELLSMTFKKGNYRVEQARDGREAWDKLRSGLPCDLIFCDIEMPRMTGLELLEKLQRDRDLKHIPIAMLTSRGADRHRQMAMQLGAKAYFTKPYLEEMLLEAAQRMLKGGLTDT
jgi:chemosensory pili system protein ChpA (sensor histidine kinase/response regulator)